jgi:hypothetical protein
MVYPKGLSVIWRDIQLHSTSGYDTGSFAVSRCGHKKYFISAAAAAAAAFSLSLKVF